jgi:hypothetical protein
MIIILSHPSIIISIVQVGGVEDLDAAFQTILDASSRQRARFCCQLRREEGCGLGLGRSNMQLHLLGSGQKHHALAFAQNHHTRPRQHAGPGTNADTKQTSRQVDETYDYRRSLPNGASPRAGRTPPHPDQAIQDSVYFK